MLHLTPALPKLLARYPELRVDVALGADVQGGALLSAPRRASCDRSIDLGGLPAQLPPVDEDAWPTEVINLWAGSPLRVPQGSNAGSAFPVAGIMCSTVQTRCGPVAMMRSTMKINLAKPELNAVIPSRRMLQLSDWKPSARDRIEGIIAYALLGVVACAIFYVALQIAAQWFASRT